MVKVRALNTYEKYQINDKELKCIPQKGIIFEVDEKRLKVLLGENDYKYVFVEVVEEAEMEQNWDGATFYVKNQELIDDAKKSVEIIKKGSGLSDNMIGKEIDETILETINKKKPKK